jgi:hypothetical protein
MAKLIRTYADLMSEICARRDALDLTHECIDHVAGFHSGYFSKLAIDLRGLGPMSLEGVLGALGAALVLVEDSAQVARVGPKWTKRRRQKSRPKSECVASKL